jgi:uncharacterized protein (DUF1778 family)
MSKSDIPLDERVIVLSKRQWDEFIAALDAPAANNPGLRALLERKPSWEGHGCDTDR